VLQGGRWPKIKCSLWCHVLQKESLEVLNDEVFIHWCFISPCSLEQLSQEVVTSCALSNATLDCSLDGDFDGVQRIPVGTIILGGKLAEGKAQGISAETAHSVQDMLECNIQWLALAFLSMAEIKAEGKSAQDINCKTDCLLIEFYARALTSCGHGSLFPLMAHAVHNCAHVWDQRDFN